MFNIPEDRPLSPQQQADVKQAIAAEIAVADPQGDPFYQAACQWKCIEGLLALLESQ